MKLGISLSGGGIKGVFHLGFLKYLKEQEIEFDVISGTSAGALAGAFYLLGHDPELIKNNMKTMRSKSITSIFKSLGGAGIIGSQSMRELIESHVLELKSPMTEKFADLDKELHVVATDLLSGDEVIFNKKETPEMDIMTSVLASSSYPMAFAPVEINGVPFSDGGIVNHFPADILVGEVDYQLGVFVTPKSRAKSSSLKNSRSVAFRAMGLQGYKTEKKKKELCNDFIFPTEIENYSTFDVSAEAIEEIYDLGYNSAKTNEELIKKLKKLMRYKFFLNK